MSEAEFAAFLEAIFRLLADNTIDGSIHGICMDWRHMPEMLAAGNAVYHELKNLCVWNKSNAGMGTFYRSKHELVFMWKSGTAPHINTFELGQYGRSRSNVWDYAGVNSLKPGRLDELAMHPTVKPVALVADAHQRLFAAQPRRARPLRGEWDRANRCRAHRPPGAGTRDRPPLRRRRGPAPAGLHRKGRHPGHNQQRLRGDLRRAQKQQRRRRAV
jgi:hypothetical protein